MHPLLPTLRPTLATRRLGLRLALFALLVMATAPFFPRLLRPAGLAGVAALCTTAPSSGAPSTPDPHGSGDVCPLCALAHAAPVLAGGETTVAAVVPFAPPAPPAPAVVRTRVVQARPPGARAPPFVA